MFILALNACYVIRYLSADECSVTRFKMPESFRLRHVAAYQFKNPEIAVAHRYSREINIDAIVPARGLTNCPGCGGPHSVPRGDVPNRLCAGLEFKAGIGV